MEAKNTDEALHNHARVTEFVQKVWNVHHEGQPLPARNAGADEDEDLIMSQVQQLSALDFITSFTPFLDF